MYMQFSDWISYSLQSTLLKSNMSVEQYRVFVIHLISSVSGLYRNPINNTIVFSGSPQIFPSVY